jgi:hypothetical protein
MREEADRLIAARAVPHTQPYQIENGTAGMRAAFVAPGMSGEAQGLAANDLKWKYFMGALVLASLAPMAMFPLFGNASPNGTAPYYAMYALVALSSNFHVGATAWFFTDREMRSHFAAHPVRYIVAPILAITATTILFVIGNEQATNLVMAIFWAWLLWHYQKQNIGILSFICSGTDRVPLSVWERRTLNLAAIAGIVWFQCGTNPDLPPSLSNTVRIPAVGLSMLLPSAFTLALAIWHQPGLLRNPLRIGALLFGFLFFLPALFFPQWHVGPFGAAHGLQYVVFMYCVSSRSVASISSVLTMLIAASLGFLLLDPHPRFREWLGIATPWFWGLTLGVVMSHFIVDAGIWRLREPFQRGYMRRKFDFVFRRSQPAPPHTR